MTKIIVIDRVSYAITSQRQYTDEGFLKVPGHVARTGTQQYLAKELGLTDRAPNDLITVYRPPEEVFNADSLASYTGVDVTIEHPDQFVNADNYRKLTGGVVVGPGTQDGDFVQCDMIIKDKEAVAAVEAGKLQLSAGYTAEYIEADDSEPYDFKQTNIRINHVALVDRARAGAQARLFDNQRGAQTMATITLDSGKTVEVEDGAAAVLIQDTIERSKQAVSDAQAETDKVQAQLDAALEENKELKVKTDDAAINERVDAVLKVKDNARKIAGADFTCDSSDPIEIQRAALAAVRDSIDWADKSEAYVDAAFDQAMEKAEEESEDEDEEENKDKKSKDSYRGLAHDMDPGQDKQTKDTRSPYQKYKDSLENAHKGE